MENFRTCIKIVFIQFFILLAAQPLFAQNQSVRGVVRDTSSVLPGVTVSVKNEVTRLLTDKDGAFEVKTSKNAVLVFNIIGYAEREIALADIKPDANGNYQLNVVMSEAMSAIEETVVTAFGQREKRSSSVGSITSISPKELKGPTGNLTTMLAGRVAGMIAFQRSGEPGADNANFFIRGVGSFGTGKQDPLILIDNVESNPTDLARLQPDDIENFSVLRDANASAVYGARGANGVVLVTTKLGREGPTIFDFRVENRISSNTRNFKFADNITYMQMANEAFLTRPADAASGQLPYWQSKIDHTIAGDDPLLYPNNNWIDQLIKDYTMNQGYNLAIKGGGAKARYYLSGTYNVDNGILKVEGINNFNNNVKLKNYNLRSNVDINFTPTTTGIVRFYAQFDDYVGPIGYRDGEGNWVNGGQATFNNAVWSNPVMFPAIYPSELNPFVKHPMFGNALSRSGGLFVNPYAQMVRGYQEYNTSTIMPQIELRQDLKALVPGLSFTGMGYVKRYAWFEVSRSYNPFYYSSNVGPEGDINLRVLNHGGAGSIGTTGTEYLGYDESGKVVTSMFYAHAMLNYANNFGKHRVSGMLLGLMQNQLNGNAGSLQLSLPARNMGLSGRFSYGFDERYMAEFNFGYNGSERFIKDQRMGFFPSFGLSYNISNEPFFESLKSSVNMLKLRATYGLVGNDQIGNAGDRFFYLSEVNMSNTGRGSSFGELGTYTRPGVSINRYANPGITWEESRQTNLGLDLEMSNGFNMNIDVYKQVRSNILTRRSFVPSTMGLQTSIVANTNKLESKGVDLTLNYQRSFGDGWYVNSRGTFTFAQAKSLIVDEPAYPVDSRYTVGYSPKQMFGYVAERLFVDDQEAVNSPMQFGTPGQDYLGGDIKYRDINGDGIISDLDRVAIGHPENPEVIYGFGGTLGYKEFDFSFFFQGSARSSFMINSRNISPFYLNGGNQNGLLEAIADSYWSEDNRDIYAFWPRLSENVVNNNNIASTWWLRNGAFLRLKNVEFGYTFKKSTMDRLRARNFRIYANGLNLFSISKFKMWDVEMGGNGIGYPVQAVYNLGLQLSF